MSPDYQPWITLRHTPRFSYESQFSSAKGSGSEFVFAYSNGVHPRRIVQTEEMVTHASLAREGCQNCPDVLADTLDPARREQLRE